MKKRVCKAILKLIENDFRKKIEEGLLKGFKINATNLTENIKSKDIFKIDYRAKFGVKIDMPNSLLKFNVES